MPLNGSSRKPGVLPASTILTGRRRWASAKRQTVRESRRLQRPKRLNAGPRDNDAFWAEIKAAKSAITSMVFGWRIRLNAEGRAQGGPHQRLDAPAASGRRLASHTPTKSRRFSSIATRRASMAYGNALGSLTTEMPLPLLHCSLDSTSGQTVPLANAGRASGQALGQIPVVRPSVPRRFFAHWSLAVAWSWQGLS